VPYIDRVVLTLAKTWRSSTCARSPASNDFQQRHLDLASCRCSSRTGQGRLQGPLGSGDYGGDMIIKFNLSYEADPEIAKWMNTADFRRALAMDRPRPDQRDVLAGDGHAELGGAGGWQQVHPGPQYRKMWPRSRSRRPTRCSTGSGWPRRTRGLPAAHRRQGPAAHRDHDAGRSVPPVHGRSRR